MLQEKEDIRVHGIRSARIATSRSTPNINLLGASRLQLSARQKKLELEQNYPKAWLILTAKFEQPWPWL